MTVRPEVCQRQQFRMEYWWNCSHCQTVWNERNTGSNWRPHDCPERKQREDRMSMQSMRDHKNHDGPR
jgi:hypothetical protein